MEEFGGGKGVGGITGVILQGGLSTQDHSLNSHFRRKECTETKIQFSEDCGMSSVVTPSQGLSFEGVAQGSGQLSYRPQLVQATPNPKSPLKPGNGSGGVLMEGLYSLSGREEFSAPLQEDSSAIPEPSPSSLQLQRKTGSLERRSDTETYFVNDRLDIKGSPSELKLSKGQTCTTIASPTSVITQTGNGCKVCSTCRMVYEESGFVSLSDSCGLCVRHISNNMKCSCLRDEECTCKVKCFTCAYCGDEFSSTVLLQKHTFTHSKANANRQEQGELEGDFKCPLCEVVSADQESLEVHLRKHSQTSCSQCKRSFVMFDPTKHSCQARFCCPLCGMGCPSNYNLKMHLLKHSGSLPYKCPHCHKAFAKPSELSRHTPMHTGERPHVCLDCGMCFSSVTNLKNHRVTHSGIRPYPWSVCNKTFTRPGDVKRHMLIHTGARPFACDVCGLTFADSSNLKKHAGMHKSGSNPPLPSKEIKTYQCTYCSKLFSRPSELKRHFFTHTNTRPYSCNFCGLAFADSSNLKKHVTTHVKASDHSCYQCDEKFNSFSDLESHMTSHACDNNAGGHVCNVCGAIFAHLADLQEHSVLHGDPQTFKCEICSKNFSQEIFLQKHIVTHTESRPYSCPECLRSFKALSHLKSHCLTHRGEKTHVCLVCNKSFLKKSSLYRHLNLHSRESKLLPLCEVFVE